MTKDPTILLCPYCQQPFKSNGINRHIAKMHKGMAQVGKDAANPKPDVTIAIEINSNAPSCQLGPVSTAPCEELIHIGDEVLRANQDPMNDSYAKDIEDCDENSKWSEVVTGDGVEIGQIDPIIESEIDKLVQKGQKSAPIPNSPIKVLSQIPIGSEIMLHGEVYWQNPANFDWELAHADKIPVVVVGLETVDNTIHLMCKLNGGQALWSILQSDVLEGKYRVIKLANSVPTTAPIPPPNGKREFVESSEELYKKALVEFLPIFNTYLEMKEKLELAERQFAEIHEEKYPIIENFVLQYGETVEDEGDIPYCVLEVDGIRMRLVAGEGLMFEKITTEV